MSANTDLNDYWTQQDSIPKTHSEPHLSVEIVEGVKPLDMQFGVADPKTVPDILYGPLFGQPDSPESELKQTGGDPGHVPTLHTYAILDAAKVTGLQELLAASGLEHRCLFKGDAFEELQDVAPWVVRLDEGNSFSRNLFTQSDAPWHLWDYEPGLYVRSRGTLDQLWQHLRKFTRVRDEVGKWFYFRFWETDCLIDYIRYAQNREGADLRFLFGFDPITSSLSLVHAYVSVGRDRAQICTVSHIAGHNTQPQIDMDAPILRFLALRGHAHRFVESYFQGLGITVGMHQLREAKDIATFIAQKYHALGFKSRYHLGSFTYWALALNSDFETQTEAIQTEVHRAEANPNDRFVTIAREMKSIFGPKIRNFHGYGR